MADFDDLIAANRAFAESFEEGGLAAPARAEVGLVTCMDSRIDPLRMLGLGLGDAKVFRNPGARVTEQAVEAMVLGAHLLGVRRIMVVPHTKCAMTSSSEAELQQRVGESAGADAGWYPIGVVADQLADLERGVARLRSHPLIPDTVAVGGFLYDVDTGLLEQKC